MTRWMPSRSVMNPFEHLRELDPCLTPRPDMSLPREPSCARLSDVLAFVEPGLGAALQLPPSPDV